MVTKHPGAALFMFMDVFLLAGALILAGAQATQVKLSSGIDCIGFFAILFITPTCSTH
jgi:hypothetical protein